jgi:hypothetical protein
MLVRESGMRYSMKLSPAVTICKVRGRAKEELVFRKHLGRSTVCSLKRVLIGSGSTVDDSTSLDIMAERQKRDLP